jgi:hypothetical protein
LNLATVTVDAFASLVGERFVVEIGEDAPVELVLTAAEDSGQVGPPGARSPFALQFRGPAQPILSQRIHRLTNDAVGQLEVFVVPIGADADGTDYEVIFA